MARTHKSLAQPYICKTHCEYYLLLEVPYTFAFDGKKSILIAYAYSDCGVVCCLYVALFDGVAVGQRW